MPGSLLLHNTVPDLLFSHLLEDRCWVIYILLPALVIHLQDSTLVGSYAVESSLVTSLRTREKRPAETIEVASCALIQLL